MAERKGFEPSMSCPIHEFQSCAFDHSATSLSSLLDEELSSHYRFTKISAAAFHFSLDRRTVLYKIVSFKILRNL